MLSIFYQTQEGSGKNGIFLFGFNWFNCNNFNMGEIMNVYLTAIAFALCFALMFLGIIIAIHLNVWLGLSLTAVGGIKFWSYLPQLN